MTNWPVAGGVVKEVPIERNLRDIRRRGGELERRVGEEGVSSTVESLKVIRGTVNTTAPTVIAGSGFTLERIEKGLCRILFTAEFTAIPSVVVSIENATLIAASQATAKTKTTIEIVAAGTITKNDGIVNFIAAGPR